MNISLLVGLKNNLEYTTHFYNTTRNLYPTIEICFVSYGSTDGTHAWLDSLDDDNVKYYYSEEQKTFADTYNKAAEIATKEYVVYLHNDIVLAPNFLENIIKHLDKNNVVSYTTVEPPIFSEHKRSGKIIQSFGEELNSFDINSFYEYSSKISNDFFNQTLPDISFFLAFAMYKKILLDIGGIDNLFDPYFYEDVDLIYRLKLLGLNLFTSLDALCYHFVSKTSRFTPEAILNCKNIETRSIRNFIRKWHSKTPVVRYAITYIVYNCKSLDTIELFCDKIYIGNQDLISNYIIKEQPNTKYDLTKKIFHISQFDEIDGHDIIIEFDYSQTSEKSFQILQNFQEIIKNNNDIGTFNLDIFKVTVNNLNEMQNSLINVN